MVFTAGQMLGIGAFTAAVLVIGMLLLKLDAKIGTNYDLAEEETPVHAREEAVRVQANPTVRTQPRRRRQRR